MDRLKKNMELLGLNPKKEALYMLACDLLIFGMGALAVIFFGNPLFFLYSSLAFVLFDFFFLTRYGKAIKDNALKRETAFVAWLSFFAIYIENGFNVYNAMKEAGRFSDPCIKDKLEKLIADIDMDKTVAPFIEFASIFETLSIKEVMLSIYQMVDEGGGESHLSRFKMLFSAISSKQAHLEREKQASLLSSLSVLPLIGSGISMLALTAALVEVMGGLFNGI